MLSVQWGRQRGGWHINGGGVACWGGSTHLCHKSLAKGAGKPKVLSSLQHLAPAERVRIRECLGFYDFCMEGAKFLVFAVLVSGREKPIMDASVGVGLPLSSRQWSSLLARYKCKVHCPCCVFRRACYSLCRCVHGGGGDCCPHKAMEFPACKIQV